LARIMQRRHFMKRQLAGTWHNQHGSELDLEIAPDGRISGTFRSATGLAKGARECPITGFASDDLIAFTANFGAYDSLTAWTGHIVVEAGETRIETQWQMAVALPKRAAADELWKGVWTGSDLFRRGPSRLEKLPAQMPSHPLPEWP
jgi:hypothetical protein